MKIESIAYSKFICNKCKITLFSDLATRECKCPHCGNKMIHKVGSEKINTNAGNGEFI